MGRRITLNEAEIWLAFCGYEYYLIMKCLDVNYLLWRKTWDTTEEEDFINGTAA